MTLEHHLLKAFRQLATLASEVEQVARDSSSPDAERLRSLGATLSDARALIRETKTDGAYKKTANQFAGAVGRCLLCLEGTGPARSRETAAAVLALLEMSAEVAPLLRE